MIGSAAKRSRILVAGVGNIFLGDDAFGVDVAQRLLERPLPEGVAVVDFGIRGLDLAYALLDDYEAVILVDAVPRGGRPGTLYTLEVDPGQPPDANIDTPAVQAHNLDPATVLQLVTALGGQVRRLVVVGCEPTPIADEDMTMGLSDAVRGTVDEAVALVEAMAQQLLHGERLTSCAATPKKKVTL